MLESDTRDLAITEMYRGQFVLHRILSLLVSFLLVLLSLGQVRADDLKRGYVFSAFDAPFGSNFDVDRDQTTFVEDLVNDNANLVRLTFSKDNSSQSYDEYITNVIVRLNEVLPALQQQGITTILSIADPPGGRSPVNGKPREVMFFKGNESLKASHIEAWRRVAAVFNGQNNLIYLPLSEGAGTKDEVSAHLINLCVAIHEADSTPVDRQPPIMLQPAYGNARFARQIDPSAFSAGRYFISTNFYPLFGYQHQGTVAAKSSKQVVAYPGGRVSTISSKGSIRPIAVKDTSAARKRKQAHSLRGLRAASKSICNYKKTLVKNYPVGSATEVLGGIVGEYAVPNYAPGARKFLIDSNKVFDSCGLWSANHARFGDPKWDVTLLCDRTTGRCVSEKGNDRHAALKVIFGKNSN